MIEAGHELRHIDRDFGKGVDIIRVGAESGIRHRNDAGVNRAKDKTCRERGVNIIKASARSQPAFEAHAWSRSYSGESDRQKKVIRGTPAMGSGAGKPG